MILIKAKIALMKYLDYKGTWQLHGDLVFFKESDPLIGLHLSMQHNHILLEFIHIWCI
jgi:hypothetical protein